jgi:hypothetical protein
MGAKVSLARNLNSTSHKVIPVTRSPESLSQLIMISGRPN